MSCRYRKQKLFPWKTFKIYHIEVDFMGWYRSQLLWPRGCGPGDGEILQSQPSCQRSLWAETGVPGEK